mgnify:CR=1 FL=1
MFQAKELNDATSSWLHQLSEPLELYASIVVEVGVHFWCRPPWSNLLDSSNYDNRIMVLVENMVSSKVEFILFKAKATTQIY